jgi:nucleoside 2-deoxyribosyltransferase
MRVYLAGPEVFLPNGRDLLAEKRALARRYGFEPHAPIDLSHLGTAGRYERGVAIAAANEARMREADAVIANLTPFRGISADPGTVYELGFMAALGRVVLAYSNDARGYFERVRDEYYDGRIETAAAGAQGADGHRIEDHDMADNLMLDGGIAARGGVFMRRAVPVERRFEDTVAFVACLDWLAAQRH